MKKLNLILRIASFLSTGIVVGMLLVAFIDWVCGITIPAWVDLTGNVAVGAMLVTTALWIGSSIKTPPK